MWYNVHITRKENWFDDDGERITLEEWNDYVRTDETIRQDPNNTEKDYIFVSSEGIYPLWYYEDRGEIYTKNPNTSTIIKMAQAAKTLNAHAQGDEGELYDENWDMINQEPSLNSNNQETKTWWKFWK